MLRAVPDVNVIVSAIITPSGYPGRIYAAWKRRRLFFITSPVIIAKVVEVLHRPHIAGPFSLDEEDISGVRSLLEKRTIRTPHRLDLHVVTQDPEDDNILIAAVEGKANCIISGDKHLTKLKTYQGIPILTPAEFVTQHQIP
jgi:putative PIN family toxin of toxin-antitoxin system